MYIELIGERVLCVCLVLQAHCTFDGDRESKSRTYFNIVDLCGILPYKWMYPYKCGIKINFDILTTQKDQ